MEVLYDFSLLVGSFYLMFLVEPLIEVLRLRLSLSSYTFLGGVLLRVVTTVPSFLLTAASNELSLMPIAFSE